MLRLSKAAGFAVLLSFGLAAVVTQAKLKPGAPPPTEKKYPAVMWRDPGDIASRDLFYGPGGKSHEPHGVFTFKEEDMNGANPKFDVVDQDGVRWRVKLGEEARPETAASRLAWAIGYFANEDYFMPVLHVEKMQRLHRGNKLVSEGNTVHAVRLKRHLKDEKKLGSWSWAKNPFTGTREWYGLRTLMAVFNNWDLKDDNNSIYLVRGDTPEEWYAVSDLGASFGPTGMNWMDKGKPDYYCKSKFIKGVSGGFVNFVAPTGPAMNYYIDFPALAHCTSLLWIGRHIPREHARWVGDLLAKLSPKQIRDAFRAAGYSDTDVDQLSKALESRITALTRL